MDSSRGVRPAVLVLLGTIEPHPDLTDDLTVAAADQRRLQYLQNFSKVLARRDDDVRGIIFGENSGAGLDDFRAMAGDRSAVEILSLPSPTVAKGLGRGYLETLLLSQVVEQSLLIGQLQDPLIVKQTARYHLRNFGAMLKSIDRTADLCINLRKFPKRWADMWFYAVSRQGMSALAERLDLLREDATGGLPSERALYSVVVDLRERGHSVQVRLSAEPHFAGYRALDGVSYTSPRQEAKWLARRTCKAVLPWLWI